MSNDKQKSQLKNSFFTIDAEDARSIQLQLPKNVINKYDPAYESYLPSNSVENITPFKDPEDNTALTKDHGLVYNTFREILDFQHPGGTIEMDGKKSKQLGSPDDETTNETLVALQNERTIETPYANKLKNRIIITQLSIDTKFRKNYFKSNSTDFIIDLTTPLTKVISMRLASLELPNISHVISANQGNHGFKYTINGVTHSPTIVSGNYEYWKLTETLNDISGGALNINGLESVINEKSLRTTISSTNGQNFKLDFGNVHDDTAPPMKTLGWLLGFRSKYYEGSNTYTSEAAIDLAGTRYCFLSINDFNSSVHDVVTVLYENSFMRDNILARVTIKEGKGVILFDDNTDNITKRRHYFGPVDVSKLHIRLIDEYGVPIDMMGIDWSFALEFQILYEK
jgi:hypothetical protein